MSESMTPEDSATESAPAPVRALRLLGGDAVVCEGDSCLVAPETPAQA